MRHRLRAASCALALVGAALVIAPTSSAAPRPLLHVSGNRILDAQGHTVVLRGLNRAGTEGGASTSGRAVSDAEIGWLARDHPSSWDATAIRVLVGEAQWTGACPNLAQQPAAYIAQIDAEVRAITRRGLVALIDLHTSTAGCSSIGRHGMPDSPVAEQFWSGAATHYAPNRLVAFELYNEPYDVNEATWRDGTKTRTFQDCDKSAPVTVYATCQSTAPRYKAAGMQALRDIVAKAAPGHLIVVDALNYGTVAPVTPLSGQVVYGIHPYTCSHTGSCQTPANDHANTEVLNRFKKLGATHPILVTEFGWPCKTGLGEVDGANYYRQTIAYLKAQKPAWGWMAFAFDGASTGAFTLTTSTTTYQPNSTGLPVYNALRSPS